MIQRNSRLEIGSLLLYPLTSLRIKVCNYRNSLSAANQVFRIRRLIIRRNSKGESH